MNPLEEPLRQFFRQLNLVYGLLFHLEYQLRNYLSAMREKFGELPATASDVSIYTTVLVEDLTHPEGVFRFPSGMFVTEGEEYFQAANKLISKNSAWAVVQGWERFESFLLDIVAAFLLAHPLEVESEALRKFLINNSLSTPETFEELRYFVKKTYRSDKLLGYLRKLAPHVSYGEINNFRQLDLRHWYKAVEKVRHAVTHSDEVISLEAYRQITSSDATLLARCFPGALEVTGYRLCLSKAAAQDTLVIFASYGFLIFKSLSMATDYEWDILNGDFAREERQGIETPQT